MILILKLIALTSTWILGIKIVTADKMVLEKLGQFGKKKVEQGYKVFEPLFVCEWCMPSLHTVIGYGFAFGLGILPIEWNWQLIIRYPIVAIGSSLVCGLTWLIYETLNQVHDRNEMQKRYYTHAERMAHWDVEDRKESHKRSRKN